MRKIFSLLLLCMVVISSAQESYKYIIVPRKIEGFKTENPYNISSNIKFLLKKNNLTAYYDTEALAQNAFNPCEALTAQVTNISTMFKNKLRISFKNCKGEEVWAKDAAGQSKEFQQGYTEATKAILEDFKTMPISNLTVTAPNVAPQNTNTIPTPQVVSQPVETTTTPAVVPTTPAAEYQPKNMYFNTTYMVDLIDKEGKKYLKIINGALLGYKDLADIAELSPSGIENTYFIKWLTPQNQLVNGVAKIGEKDITISIPNAQSYQLINLKKP